jgi:hypothetical protein
MLKYVGGEKQGSGLSTLAEHKLKATRFHLRYDSVNLPIPSDATQVMDEGCRPGYLARVKRSQIFGLSEAM